MIRASRTNFSVAHRLKGRKFFHWKSFFAVFSLAALVCLCAAATVVAASTDTLRLQVAPVDIWPPRPINDFTIAPNTEGSVLLNWTAPYEDTALVPKTNPVQGYTVRYATFSPADLSGDTTAWFNLAPFSLT